MSSTGVNYAYVIRLNWVQGDKSNDYVLGVCSSIRNLNPPSAFPFYNL